MIVKVLGVPLQVIPPLVNTGVTVMVPEIGADVVLVPTKVGILPVPLAARPIAVLVLVQL